MEIYWEKGKKAPELGQPSLGLWLTAGEEKGKKVRFSEFEIREADRLRSEALWAKQLLKMSSVGLLWILLAI